MENEIRPLRDTASEVRGRLRERPEVLAALIVLFAVVALIVYWAVWADRAPSWTGFGAYDEKAEGPRAKTLWDWMELLIIPAALALVAIWFNKSQKETEQRIAEKARETEREIAKDRHRQTTLERYYDRMTELLLDHGLAGPEPNSEVQSIARATTITVVRGLDWQRNRQLFEFISLSRLLEPDAPVIHFDGVDFSYVDLQAVELVHVSLALAVLAYSNLYRAQLVDCNLRGGNLVGTNLMQANLAGTDMFIADLRGANLTMVHLNSTNLIGAHNWTWEQFSRVATWKDTTMPDGITLGGFLNSGPTYDEWKAQYIARFGEDAEGRPPYMPNSKPTQR